VIQASKDMPKSSSGGASGQVGSSIAYNGTLTLLQMNLSSYIDSSQLHGLNVDSRFPVTSVIGAEKPIKSDTDEQGEDNSSVTTFLSDMRLMLSDYCYTISPESQNPFHQNIRP